MKKTLAVLGGLVVVLIPVYLTYYLNRNIADIRYTLSERIPVNFTNLDEKPSSGVQQLDVRNIGSAEAKKVVIKISGEVTTYRLEKASEVDEVKVFTRLLCFK